MAPPNSERAAGEVTLHQADRSAEERPNKRLKDAHLVSANSSRAASPTSDDAALLTCLQLLFSELPSSLSSSGDVSVFREVWASHGFKTSMVTSPHQAVSVYLDSCRKGSTSENEAGRNYLLSCIGMNSQQISLESVYASIKSVYYLHLFLARMRAVRKQDTENQDLCAIFVAWESELNAALSQMKDGKACMTKLSSLAEQSSQVLCQLVSKLTDIDHSLRSDQILREYNRITYENCTLSNACLQKWLYSSRKPKFLLDQMHFQCSPRGNYIPNRERVTISMRGENAEGAPEKLILLPSLTQILLREDTRQYPLDEVVEKMICSTWDDLLRNGYYVDQNRKEQLSEPLKKFYMSGLLAGKESNMPILLNAHFSPTYPLSLYLWGMAGAGKSSFVRNLFPALNTAISKYADPELMVRFVKQNLNKPLDTLKLELELRPNNNDYSVMSIIQGRRMTLSQSKPGLVMVGLEEMPSIVEGADPNQLEVSKLISNRFSGRTGDFKEGDAPRNSGKRGISGDTTIISVFTSNYEIEKPCMNALQRLEMFQNLYIVQITSVCGKEREEFAKSYLMQRVNERLSAWKGKLNISLDVPLGDGDTRPLVRYLRMLSFYIYSLVVDSASMNENIDVVVSFDTKTNITTLAYDGKMMHLKSGSFNNIYALTPSVLDSRTSEIASRLRMMHPDLKNPEELCQILDFYFAKTLAPAVVLSSNRQLIYDMVNLLSKSEGVHGIPNIDPASYKIMKSLYDSNDTPNLRDDIINVLKGNDEALVAIQLNCTDTDAQMQIREIVEDTPSMTAFSTERSALHKEGLLFGIFVDGTLTPEIESRASLII